MPSGILKIATCQFGVSGSIERNAEAIRDFLRKAAKAEADIVHFSECALSGYAGTDFDTLDGYNWQLLGKQSRDIMALAGELGLWVVLGSTHRLTGANKPHNSLYVIGPNGEIIDRYDKRFCTTIDLQNYTPGGRFVIFTVNGVKCSLLICFDLRFPEIYRQLYKHGVQCVFQSFYNARQNGPSVHSDIMRQSMQCRAATNYFWVSMTNSCAWYSPYPSCFIQPEGRIAAQLEDHKEGLMINTVNINEAFYDPMAEYRDMVIEGALSNGPDEINDPRSKEVKKL